MPQFHKKKTGSRKYKDFHDVTVEQAIVAVHKGTSQMEVSAQLNSSIVFSLILENQIAKTQ